MLLRRALLLLACCSALAARADDEVVEWRDAGRCVGRVCSLRGTVVESEVSGPTIRLYFDAQDRTARVLLMRGWLVTWPDYLGRTIVATGKAQRFREHVEIIVLDPSDIAVIGAPPAIPVAAAATGASPAAPSSTAVPATAVPATAVPATAVPATAVPAAVPATTAPAAAAPPTSTAGELEELRQRMRELQQRIDELEGR